MYIMELDLISRLSFFLEDVKNIIDCGMDVGGKISSLASIKIALAKICRL